MDNLNVYRSYGEVHTAGLEFVLAKMDGIDTSANANQSSIENALTYVAEFCCNALFDKKRLSREYFKLLDQTLTIGRRAARSRRYPTRPVHTAQSVSLYP